MISNGKILMSVGGVGASMVVAGLLLAACGSPTSSANQPNLDAGQTGKVDNTAAITIANPDGFSNISAKCVGKDGVYAAYHSGGYASIQVVPGDPNCESGTYVDTNAR